MKLSAILDKYNFPSSAKKVYQQSGIENLFPPQAEAIDKGVLEGKNLLLSVPTAAGKTLIAELAMLRSVLQEGGHCLYIVPLKALASEKYEDFKNKFAPLGVRVGMATGDSETPHNIPGRYHILISTAEKIDSLFRSRCEWLINKLSVVILDEIHFINDGSRGPTLEILIARIKQLNPDIQTLALSATVSNAAEMAQWLKANLVLSEWRPIPLKEGVYFQEQIKFKGHANRKIAEDSREDITKLVIDTLRGKGQVLIFVNSRRSTQAASRLIAPKVAQTLTPEEKNHLTRIAKDVAGSQESSTKICQTLAETVTRGVAFHHAGLKPKQRKIIEDNFKKNIIKVICSTPTLAAGVNLPARRAIIRDVKRFESGLGSAYIPTSEYKQCAGRAGRPQYDDYGEAVLIAKTLSQQKTLFHRYIDAAPEPIISKLGQEPALRIHILASIAGGYVHDINDTFAFLSQSFLAHQKHHQNLIEIIGNVFEFLEGEGFIEKNGFRFLATPFGQCTSRLYIDPLSSLILRRGLERINEGKSFSNIGLLHLLICCPDSPLLKNISSMAQELERFGRTYEDEFILNEDDLMILEDYMIYLCVMKTTFLLSRWIEEDNEAALCESFNVGPGDIYRHIESTQWLIHAAIIFADLFQFKKIGFLLADLKSRIRYGIKEELIALTQLKNIGRIRARNLFDKGYKKLTDLKYASLDDIAKIPSIGRTVAKDILDQVTTKNRTARIEDMVRSNIKNLKRKRG
ncbi:MAG: DEAD/DEAH box helicase [Candidatus Omnitrophica bacterium]|nr:DEAD/DEAH box helicase [Candidatus Omnitrophota bacterium]